VSFARKFDSKAAKWSTITVDMKISRPSRFILAAITLFSILFMQLAVASYACPSLSTSQGEQLMSSAMADGDMVACQDMDPVQPSLCHAYGQSGDQSLDKPAVPPLQPFLAVGVGLLVTPREIANPVSFGLPNSTFLTHATAPPVAIRNCCFRI
jgi:hypothetical protein